MRFQLLIFIILSAFLLSCRSFFLKRKYQRGFYFSGRTAPRPVKENESRQFSTESEKTFFRPNIEAKAQSGHISQELFSIKEPITSGGQLQKKATSSEALVKPHSYKKAPVTSEAQISAASAGLSWAFLGIGLLLLLVSPIAFIVCAVISVLSGLICLLFTVAAVRAGGGKSILIAIGSYLLAALAMFFAVNLMLQI